MKSPLTKYVHWIPLAAHLLTNNKALLVDGSYF